MTQGDQAYPEPRRSNGLGVAGFIVSLVGIFTGGLLSVIGLLLSFIALFRRPRGFAFAGFIIGLVGTAELALILAFFGLITLSCLSVGGPPFRTALAEQEAQTKIHEYSSAHMGALPNKADGDALISGLRDGWGHPMSYEPIGMGGVPTFQIRSAGPDGIFNTGDDIVQ